MTTNDKKLYEEIENCLEYDDDIYGGDSVFLHVTSIENLLVWFKIKEIDILKEFVEYIKQSWQEEINTYESLQKEEDCPYIAREAIKSKLIGMRKMLGLLGHDLEKFLEDKKLIALLDPIFETFLEKTSNDNK